MDGKYLNNEHLTGFENYKYSSLDTSPLSIYVMHPFWNKIVVVYPDEDHTIKITKPPLYRQIDQFFDDSFGPITFDDWESEGGFFIQ